MRVVQVASRAMVGWAVLLALLAVVTEAWAEDPCARYGLSVAEAQALDWRSPGFDPRRLADPLWAHYRQTEVRPRDPAGDYSLALWVATTLRKVGLKLGGPLGLQDLRRLEQRVAPAAPCAELIFGAPAWVWPRYSIPAWVPDRRDQDRIREIGAAPEVQRRLLVELASGQWTFHTSRSPVDVPAFAAMLDQVLREESRDGALVPRPGTPHRWDPGSFALLDRRFFPVTRFSKLLIALARGELSRYAVTGQEEALRAFLRSQPEQSVTHDRLFRQALRLNQGDVYQALVTIEGVLSQFWRDPSRERIDFIRALEPYANAFGSNSDTFGTWYHFYGVLLLGYVEGGAWARKVGQIESLGSGLLSPGVDKTQKRWVNRLGGDIGSRLRRSVESRTWSQGADDPRLLERASYLRTDPEVRRRIEQRARELETPAR